MAYMIKKTAVIGLGGTGMHAVLTMKKRFLETYGEIPPMMKFLVIDTTDKDHLQGEGEGENIKLEPGEFLKLEVKNPGSLMKTNKEVKAWLPDNVPKFALTSGAKQVRPLGRLAVFANANDLNAKINGLINSIKDFRIGRYSGDKYELLSENIVVNIVCSFSGGTGSGCFLDVGALSRKNLAGTDKLIGYFLLPDVFVGKTGTANVEPNAYGAIKELNSLYNDGQAHKYILGGSERTLEEGLFNAVYLVNNMNKQGIKYSEIRDLQEFLGMGMFLQSSSTGKGASDIIDNIEVQTLQNRWYDKPTVYSSFGIGELIYPGDWFADLFAKEIALNVIQKTFFGGEISGIKEFTEDFISKIGIREDTTDEVIDSILAPGDYKKFPLPPELNKETIITVFGKRESYLNDIQRDIRVTAKENLAKIKDEKIADMNAELANRLSTPQGLEFSKNFLLTLLGRLAEFKNMMKVEREDCTKQKEELEGKYTLVKSEAETASKKLFGSKGAIEQVLKDFKGLVDKEAGLTLEIERREEAIEFFVSIIDEANKWSERLNAFSEYCSALTQELNKDIQRKKNEKKAIKPFVHEIKPKELKELDLTVEPNDFLTWLSDAKQLDVLRLAEMRIGEIKSVLLEYGNSQEKVENIKTKRIDDILKELPQEKMMEYVQLLDKMASPLWQYDQGLVAADKKTENIYLFGVENPDDTVFIPEEIKTAIDSAYPQSVVGTGDPKRVVCLKVESAVPAFVVNDMPRYREKYKDPNKPFSYHIHKDWENELPALFPGTEEEEARKYWSIGLAEPFNLLSKTGEFYYIKSNKRGKKLEDYKVKLAQGRVEAMRSFLDDVEFIDEMRENIEKISQKLGNEAVAETLKNYGNDLEIKAKKSGKEIRDQIELELNDIEEYVQSLLGL